MPSLDYLAPFYFLLCLIASSKMLQFIVEIFKLLLNQSSISKEAYVMCGLLGAIAITLLLFVGLGIYKETIGTYCAGLLGDSSCTTGPLLFAVIFVNPISLIIASSLSSYALSTLPGRQPVTNKKL